MLSLSLSLSFHNNLPINWLLCIYQLSQSAVKASLFGSHHNVESLGMWRCREIKEVVLRAIHALFHKNSGLVLPHSLNLWWPLSPRVVWSAGLCQTRLNWKECHGWARVPPEPIKRTKQFLKRSKWTVKKCIDDFNTYLGWVNVGNTHI